MEITKTVLEEELKNLKAQRDSLQASVNHFLGAIALCNRLLKMIDETEPTDDAGQVQ